MSHEQGGDKDDETMRHQIDATRTETVRFVDRLESKWRDIVAAQKRGDYNEAEQCRAEFRSMLHGGWTEIKDALLASSARSSVATNEGETPRTDALMNMQMSDNPECGGHRIGDAIEGTVIDFCRQLERELAVQDDANEILTQRLAEAEARLSATAELDAANENPDLTDAEIDDLQPAVMKLLREAGSKYPCLDQSEFLNQVDCLFAQARRTPVPEVAGFLPWTDEDKARLQLALFACS